MTAATAPFNRFEHVLLRKPGANLAASKNLSVGIPDPARAESQLIGLEYILRSIGASTAMLSADASTPDSVFIGDEAVIAGRLAVLNATSATLAADLAGTHFLKFISPPGKISGRDVVALGDHYYIGISGETNQEGAAQLAYFLKDFGYSVTIVVQDRDMPLRLKTSAVGLGHNRLLLREELATHFAFLTQDKTTFSAKEPGIGHAMVVNGTLLTLSGAATGLEKKTGLPVITINMSEFEKIGGGLSSLMLPLPPLEKGRIDFLPRRKAA